MIRRRATLGALVLTLLVAAPGVLAAQLALDPTFSDDGKTRIEGTDESGTVTSLEKHGGKIYASGWSVDAELAQIFVARYTDTGNPDLSYGTLGLSRTLPGSDSLVGVGFDVDDVGGVAVVGQSFDRVIVGRLTPTGEPDTSFSGDGFRYLRHAGTNNAFDPAVVIDGEGRLIVGTTVRRNPGLDASLYRLLPDGNLDKSFARDGIRRFNFGEKDWMDALAVDRRNRVVLGTDTESADNPNAPTRIVRLRENGTYDLTFSENGMMLVRLVPRSVTVPVAVGVRMNGVITVGLTNGSDAYGVARVRQDGELKRSYGDNGVLGLTCDCRVLEGDIVNGRVVLSGSRADATTLVTRISPDGSSISQGWIDLYPASRKEEVHAVTFDGTSSVLGGTVFDTAFLARTK
jgi:uncharacterized delta-60 repeat protein